MTARKTAKSGAELPVFLSISALFTILYLNRFLIPDHFFDTINYHLFLGYRGIRHFFRPWGPDEILPTFVGFIHPFYDVIQFAAYEILGYRLGTVLGLLACVGLVYLAIQIVKLLLPDFLEKHPWLAFGVVLNSVWVFHLLFQLAGYGVGILNTLFLVAGLYFWLSCFTQDRSSRQKSGNLLPLFVAHGIWGLACLGKLISAVYVAPFTLITLWKLFRESPWNVRNLMWKISVSLAVLALTVLPALAFMAQMYAETGNPLFPLFNGIFKSPYAVFINLKFSRNGGHGLTERFLWPVMSLFHPERLGTPRLNDWRLHAYWLTHGLFFLSYRKKMTSLERQLFVAFFAGSYLWAVLFGIMRYAIFAEVFGGLLMILLIRHAFPFLAKGTKVPAGQLSTQKVLAGILAGMLLVFWLQDTRQNLQADWSWRPPFWKYPQLHLRQVPELFRRKLKLPPEWQKNMEATDVVINCTPPQPNSGYYILSDYRDKPLLIYAEGFHTKPDIGYTVKMRELTAKYEDEEGYLDFLLLEPVKGNSKSAKEKDCSHFLKQTGAVIQEEAPLRDFLGYDRIELNMIKGKLKI